MININHWYIKFYFYVILRLIREVTKVLPELSHFCFFFKFLYYRVGVTGSGIYWKGKENLPKWEMEHLLIMWYCSLPEPLSSCCRCLYIFHNSKIKIQMIPKRISINWMFGSLVQYIPIKHIIPIEYSAVFSHNGEWLTLFFGLPGGNVP